MERINLLKILQGDINLIDKINIKDIALFEVNVTIYPENVRAILRLFLQGHLTPFELTKWAKFICARAEYSCPNWEDDKMADYYEDMWYVIQRLSTPEIDGEITENRVRQYLAELEKYGDE